MNFAASSIAAFLAASSFSMVSAQSVSEVCSFGPDGVNLSLAAKGGPGGMAPRHCFEFGGVERCYYTYIPASCKDSTQKVPLVVDSHGTFNCPGTLVQYSGWVEKAEEECLVVLMPSASMDPLFSESCFNLQGFAIDLNSFDLVATSPCCCNDGTAPAGLFSAQDDPDDAAFVKMAIDDALARFPNGADTSLTLDSTRVYMAGHSNGCMTSLSVAARFSDTVAAVCCHAGTIITGFDQDGYSPVPIWMVSGAKDSLVAYNGQSVPVPGVGTIGQWSNAKMYSYLLNANGCTISSIGPVEDGGDTVGSVMTAGACTDGATVEFLTLDESGHDVYNTFYVPEYGGSPTTVDTTALAYEFCAAFSSNYAGPPTAAPTSSPTAPPTTMPPTSAKEGKKAAKKEKKAKKTKGPKSAKA
jgi:poly(3-hydroxybutyrate) depolymerase